MPADDQLLDVRDGANVVADWRSLARVRDDGPSVSLLHESPQLKVVLVALAAGQGLPDHPGPAACFHFLDGEGEVVVDGHAAPAPTA